MRRCWVKRGRGGLGWNNIQAEEIASAKALTQEGMSTFQGREKQCIWSKESGKKRAVGDGDPEKRVREEELSHPVLIGWA